MSLRPIEVALTVSESTNTYPLTAEDNVKVYPVTLSETIVAGNVPNYEGSYVVTPTRNQQVLYTADRRLLHNVIINPIPSNYGLVEWNGSALRIS